MWIVCWGILWLFSMSLNESLLALTERTKNSDKRGTTALYP